MSVPHQPSAQSADPAVGPRRVADPNRVYGSTFWYAYASNTAFMIAYALLYRYADFILYLGGNELDLGRIVGVGMVGSLLMRFFQGYGIDHYGARHIWLWSILLFAASVLGNLFVGRVDGPTIYLLRIGLSTAVAGFFGASITSVSRRMPVERMAEVIGLLGTSGFLAIGIGPLLGDVIFGRQPTTRGGLVQMFVVAAALALVSLVTAALATRGEPAPRRRRRPPMLWLLRRYHPGPLLAVAAATGTAFALPATFLAMYADTLRIDRLAGFWTVYAATAFTTRIATRRFSPRFGVRPMVHMGLAAMVVSLLCYLPVHTAGGLALPGFFGGLGHALLYPAIVAQGTSAFPNRYRGLGTTVTLAMVDVGMLVGAPLFGAIVDRSNMHGLPGYPTAFIASAAAMLLVDAWYALSGRWSNAKNGRTRAPSDAGL